MEAVIAFQPCCDAAVPKFRMLRIKTCKKCKYQKEIKKVDHKYVNKTTNTVTYDYWIGTFYCHGTNGTCPDGFKVTMKFDNEGNTAPDSEYPTAKAAFDALQKHMAENCHEIWGGTDGYEPCGERHEVIEVKKLCKWCNKPKVQEKPLEDKIREKHPEWYE